MSPLRPYPEGRLFFSPARHARRAGKIPPAPNSHHSGMAKVRLPVGGLSLSGTMVTSKAGARRDRPRSTASPYGQRMQRVARPHGRMAGALKFTSRFEPTPEGGAWINDVQKLNTPPASFNPSPPPQAIQMMAASAEWGAMEEEERAVYTAEAERENTSRRQTGRGNLTGFAHYYRCRCGAGTKGPKLPQRGRGAKNGAAIRTADAAERSRIDHPENAWRPIPKVADNQVAPQDAAAVGQRGGADPSARPGYRPGRTVSARQRRRDRADRCSRDRERRANRDRQRIRNGRR